MTTTTELKRAAGYWRVSTLEQSDERHVSLETQSARIDAYCRASNSLSAGSYTDVASGRRDDRRQYQEMVDFAAGGGAEVIVAELGDGILGEYGVQEILADAELKRMSGVFVLCANDPVGVWGATRVLKERFEIGIDVVCGPATDNSVGTRYVTEQLGLTAINARTHGVELGEFVAGRIGETAGKAPQ